MIEYIFISIRIIDGRPRRVIVDEIGNIVNRNPNKEELECLDVEPYTRNIVPRYYNETNICPRCREENRMTEISLLYPGNARREKDKDGTETGEWICHYHWNRDYQKYHPNSLNNIIKSIANCRTGNQNPEHSNVEGDKVLKLACKIYGWEDLNKKNDNYSVGTPIDCYDPKTGLFHQVRGKCYDPINRYWVFGKLEKEWHKEYEDMVCYCKSKDGKKIERIYKIPSWEIKGRKSIAIVKNPTDCVGDHMTPWYEKYRVDEEELKESNSMYERKY